ncbi:MAG: SHOCT domain-containing protein [Chloroflexi bacterium]|nr:SHOCT domain-containing protein [Chloroflexota bacterium]
MKPSPRRFGWILALVAGLAVLALGALWIGAAIGHGRVVDGMPMRAWAFGWSRAGGLLGLLWIVAVPVLVGVGIGLLVAVARGPSATPPPPVGPPVGQPPVASGPLGPPPDAAPGAPPAAGPAPAADGAARLEQLAAMHAEGILSDEEFAAAKRRLLGLDAG